MIRFRITLCLSIATLALSLSSGSRAQSSASEKASAEALFDDGVALVAAGNYAGGCSKFEASQTLEPTLGTELHLADCYERLGKTASAWALFKESEELARRQNESSRQQLAQIRAAALARQLSYLVIDTAEEPTSALVVERNGHAVPLGSLGVAIPVDPGPQEIRASAPLHRSWSTRIVVPRGSGTVNVSIPRLGLLVAKPGAGAQGQLRHDDNGNTQRAIGVTSTAVGVVGILVGLGLGLYAKRENDESRLARYCPTDSHNGCTSEGVNLRQRAEQFASASTVTLVASGAVLAGGILLWSTTPSAARQTPTATLGLNAVGSRDSLQAALAGRF